VSDLAYTVERLAHEHSLEAVVEQRTIRLPQPVKGDPSLTVLRVLGVAQDDAPVGAAAHSGNIVAIGVWRDPDVYLARWTNGKRWVTAYRLSGDTKPNTYVRTEQEASDLAREYGFTDVDGRVPDFPKMFDANMKALAAKAQLTETERWLVSARYWQIHQDPARRELAVTLAKALGLEGLGPGLSPFLAPTPVSS